MQYLVVSRKSALFHLAKWLTGELGEQNVRCVSLKENYQKKAWSGLLKQGRLPKRTDPATWLKAFLGDATLVTDDRGLTTMAVEQGLPVVGQLLFPTDAPDSPLAAGGWWNGTELLSPHWVVFDWGLWPGGLGPKRLGGLTLLRNDTTPPPVKLFEAVAQQLQGFRGAVSLDLHWDEVEHGWRSGALRAGWGPHSYLMLHGMPSAEAVLGAGGAPVLAPAVVGVPVSIPPFPYSSSGSVPTPFVSTPETQRALILDDVQLSKGGLSTAGLSGSVALAIGRGRQFLRAQQDAVAVAQSLELPEQQWRPDVGQWVPQLLVALEQRGWWA